MNPTNNSPKLLLNAREAARTLGVCPKTLWNLSWPRGTIPIVRIGARVLYDPEDLRAWIEKQKAPDTLTEGDNQEG